MVCNHAEGINGEHISGRAGPSYFLKAVARDGNSAKQRAAESGHVGDTGPAFYIKETTPFNEPQGAATLEAKQ